MYKTQKFYNPDTFTDWANKLNPDENEIISVIPHGTVIVVLYKTNEENTTKPEESVGNEDVTDPKNSAVISAGQIQHPFNESSANSMIDRLEVIPLEPTPEEVYQTAYRDAIKSGQADPEAKKTATEAAQKTRDEQKDKAGKSSVPNASLLTKQAQAQARASELRPAIEGTGLFSVEDHKVAIQDKINSGDSILNTGDISQTQRGETGGVVTASLPGAHVVHGTNNVHDMPAQPNSIALVPQGIGEVGVQFSNQAPPLYPIVGAAQVSEETAPASAVSPLTVVASADQLEKDAIGEQPNSIVEQPAGTSPSPELAAINSGLARQAAEDMWNKLDIHATPVAPSDKELEHGEQRSSITQDVPSDDKHPIYPSEIVTADSTLAPSETTPEGAPTNSAYNSGLFNSTPVEGMTPETNS